MKKIIKTLPTGIKVIQERIDNKIVITTIEKKQKKHEK